MLRNRASGPEIGLFGPHVSVGPKSTHVFCNFMGQSRPQDLLRTQLMRNLNIWSTVFIYCLTWVSGQLQPLLPRCPTRSITWVLSPWPGPEPHKSGRSKTCPGRLSNAPVVLRGVFKFRLGPGPPRGSRGDGPDDPCLRGFGAGSSPHPVGGANVFCNLGKRSCDADAKACHVVVHPQVQCDTNQERVWGARLSNLGPQTPSGHNF